MASAPSDANHLRAEAAQSFAHELVPLEDQGSGWRIFFIVAGSQCGLPAFLLGAQLAGSLGLIGGARAAITGALVLATLASVSAYTGSRTRMSLAILSTLTFGSKGAQLVRLLIALSLVGWFGVAISVLGATASGAIADMTGHLVAPPFLSVPLSLAIAWVAMRGAQGLERLGMVLIPLAFAILGLGVWLSVPHMGQILSLPGTGHLGFGAAVSSVVGDYIVGAVIQPDYGRFVRRPAGAAAGAAGALAVVLPLVLVASAVPGLMVGKDNLIAAMIALGFGLPALVVLLMGAWIDASACLYSGGLSLANQFPRFDFRTIIAGSALVGVVLALARVDTLFVPFLVALGVALPPIAAVQVVSALRRPPPADAHTIEAVALRPAALLAWAAGTLAGVLTSYEVISISGIAAVDSVLVAGAVALVTSFTRSDR